MSASPRTALLLAGCLVALAHAAAAQSAQKFSLQASGAILFATRKDPDYDSKRRLGYEAQARYTFGRLSLGAGYQRSTVFSFPDHPLTLALSFGFVEPRFVVTAGRAVAFYLAGRAGVGKIVCSTDECPSQKTRLGFGGGGGLLFRLSNRLSGDLGGQFFQAPALSAPGANRSSGYAMIRAGLGLGL